MGIFNNDKNIGGFIAYYKLTDWFLNNFSSDEQNYIVDKFQPLGGSSNLINGNIGNIDQGCYSFLCNLSGWFKSKDDFNIAKKIIEKAESEFNIDSDILDKHFYYMTMLNFYYKDRKNLESYNKAKDYCLKQINVSNEAKKAFKKEYGKNSSLPSHTGYKQYVIILEKEKDFLQALEFAKKAYNEGWTGEDWSKKIEKLENKLLNTK